MAESNAQSQEKLDQYLAAKDLLAAAATQQAETKQELHNEFKSLRELQAEENRRRHEETKKKEECVRPFPRPRLPLRGAAPHAPLSPRLRSEEEAKFEEKRAKRQEEEREKARPKQEEQQSKARELNAEHSANLNLVHDVSESRKLRRQDIRSYANAVKNSATEAHEVESNSDPEKEEGFVNQRLNGGILAKRSIQLQEERDCGCDEYDPHGIEECMANCRQGSD